MSHNGVVDENAVSAGRIAANLLTFGRVMRAAGLPLGTGQVLNLVSALGEINPRRKDDVYHACRATLLTRPEQIPLFDSEFGRFWRRLVTHEATELEAFRPNDQPESMPIPDDARPRETRAGAAEEGSAERERTLLAIEDAPDESVNDGEEEFTTPPEDVLLFSSREALRKKDFSQFTPQEIAEARGIIDGMTWRLGLRETRRRRRATRGEFIDHRATLRAAMRHGGVPLELRRRRRAQRMRPLVLICDISGSMERYARLLLRFVHALEHGLDATEVFVFGTRLTRITRERRKRDVDGGTADVVKSVDDWSGGTRIGEAIKAFNFRWSRRVVRSGATIVIISDGWDRGDPALLGAEMARLQRSCRRLIWLNPLLGAPGYQPLTQGIRAALPFVDHFLPIHNLQSLDALASLLSAVSDRPPPRGHITVTARSPLKGRLA
ncbi:MAG: VWA domain-containing protein [Chloroflexota bacterium]|nr:VWA domain-containing protein [Chloroflexota bacterium]